LHFIIHIVFRIRADNAYIEILMKVENLNIPPFALAYRIVQYVSTNQYHRNFILSYLLPYKTSYDIRYNWPIRMTIETIVWPSSFREMVP